MTRWRAVGVVLAAACAGCGYHLANAAGASGGPISIVGGPSTTPDAALAGAAEAGARAELARADALGGSGAPREIMIEILRVDEAAEAIHAGIGGVPTASAVRVTALGRARLRRRDTGAVERETGNLHVTETAARAPSVAAGAVTRDEAGRAAARRLGEALVRALLGRPDPEEP
jgi:hypothetical protein